LREASVAVAQVADSSAISRWALTVAESPARQNWLVALVVPTKYVNRPAVAGL
jgi:hypothetical protein